MRIAIIAAGYFPVVDGVSVLIRNTLECLSREGHQVLLVCPDYSDMSIYPNWREFSGDMLPGVRVLNLPGEKFFVEFERTLCRKALAPLERALEDFRPDIVHVDEPEKIALVSLSAAGTGYARKRGIPCVAMCHTDYISYADDFFAFLPGPFLRLFKRTMMALFGIVYNRYDMTLAYSAKSRENLEAMRVRNVVFGRFAGVDLSRFSRIRSRDRFFAERHGLEGFDDSIVVTWCGRLTPDKNWNALIECLPGLVESLADLPVAFAVVGDGEMRDALREAFEGAGARFRLFGRMQPDDFYELLAHSDVHVSNSEKENLGLTVLDAFAVGVPVVAPAAGGLTQFLVHGANGLLYSPGDMRDFLATLGTIVRDDAMRARLARGAAEGSADHDHVKVAERIVEAWRDAIARKLEARAT